MSIVKEGGLKNWKFIKKLILEISALTQLFVSIAFTRDYVNTALSINHFIYWHTLELHDTIYMMVIYGSVDGKFWNFKLKVFFFIVLYSS